MEDIYEAKYVEDLFNRMSGSYQRMNYITSFGFSHRWRKQCVKRANISEGHVVADLMTGMGECWNPIVKRIGKKGKLIALDFSEGMLKHTAKRLEKHSQMDIQVLNENVFDNSIPSSSVDRVISGFGIKTFSEDQLFELAKEIQRILKPYGEISLIDVSVPRSSVLRAFYMMYLKFFIPILGRLFLGNPSEYRMLGIYTDKFKNARKTEQIFNKAGLEVSFSSYFYGCASGVIGSNAAANNA